MNQYTGNYSWLVSKYGKVMENHQELGKALREAGPISKKNANLIQLAAAAASKAEGAVHSHVRRALEAGATSEEIYHTIILLTSTIGFPAVAAALSWTKEIVEG
ncbi:MAG: carboxymuconolactone decarboxylase family protein [Deltaproteobacteria bacterium]|jgi:AhpD family alkylhydroperoxidase|nr:MAG: carboxymuconolactone decarboxylase family protein [Deltaproteobacteria bacterium]